MTQKKHRRFVGSLPVSPDIKYTKNSDVVLFLRKNIIKIDIFLKLFNFNT